MSKVLHFFEQISQIPRGSGNEKQISGWLKKFAEDRGLWVLQDSADNIVIKKPGTAGYEQSEPIILQGHMDMVCEKNKNVEHDFLKDPIRLKIDGDTLSADGTTLGGDDGIAVAMCLALLDADDIPHPPLEILFTTDEEAGMTGAEALDASIFSGRKLINLDSEEEGVFCPSCAGGVRINITLPVEREELPAECGLYALRVKGLKGGHSGMEIDKGRANSHKLIGRVLRALIKECKARIVSIDGGLKMNAIPREAEALITLCEGTYDAAAKLTEAYEQVFKREYHVNDPYIQLELTRQAAKGPINAFTEACAGKAVDALYLIPFGVVGMSADMPGLVETSNNIGIVNTDGENITFSNSTRSSVESQKFALQDQLEIIAELLGARFEAFNGYPGWEYNPHSPLRDALVSLYEEMYGHKPQVAAVHAGLECGLFAQKMPGVDMISFGPNLYDVHSPDEHLSIASVERVWEFLQRALVRV
jgi:dipeptidase D